MPDAAPVIAVLTDRYADYRKVLVDGVAAAVGEAGYGALCVAGRELAGDYRIEREAWTANAIYRHVERADVAGIVCLSANLGRGVDERRLGAFLRRFRPPTVSIGVAVEGIASVAVDEDEGMRRLVEHVLGDCRCERPVFLRGLPGDAFSRRREARFREGLARRGIAIDESLFLDGRYDALAAYRAIGALIESGGRFDAVVAANDVMASGAARALSRHDRGDVVVAGFDDTPEATALSPALTSVRQPVAEMAALGARLLLEAIAEAPTAGERPNAVRPPLLHVCGELVVRASTAARAKAATAIDAADRVAVARHVDATLGGLVAPPGCRLEPVLDALTARLEGDPSRLSDTLDRAIAASPPSAAAVHWWSVVCERIGALGSPSSRGAGADEISLEPDLVAARARLEARRADLAFRGGELRRLSDAASIALGAATDTESLLDAFGRWLEAAGIERCFLVRHEWPHPVPYVTGELLADHRRDGTPLPAGEAFATRELLPEARRAELARGQLVLLPLCAELDHYGYLLIDPSGPVELPLEAIAASLASSLRAGHMIRALEDRAEMLQLSNAGLLRSASHDALTGLPNRPHFQERLRRFCEAAEDGAEATLLFVDLDGFKLVNDTLGHDAGDGLLCEIARRLERVVARANAVGEFVARLGGDEYVVLMTHGAGHDVEADARAILAAVAEPCSTLGDETVVVSASIGAARYPHDSRDAELLVRQADRAMFEAKRGGKHDVVFYSPDLCLADGETLSLMQEMRTALPAGEFRMHFQPRVALADGAVVGAEALMRWWRDTPGEGMRERATPGEFIPLAERSGFVTELDRFALEEACRHAALWMRRGHRLAVSVNVSTNMLRQRDLVALVGAALARHGTDPALIELEITESGLMHDIERGARTLGELRAMGLKISLDDFGTGQSSLCYLANLPVQALKIDRSFLEPLADGVAAAPPRSVTILRTIAALGRSLGIELVAEGIETEAQHDFAEHIGCRFGQGFLHGRPCPPEALSRRLGAEASWPLAG